MKIESIAPPEYQTLDAAGADLVSFVKLTISPKMSGEIKTGTRIALPRGHVAFVRGRSGLAFKFGIWAFEGTIDADYRGEIKVLLFNTGNEPYTVNVGDRIAQLVVLKYEHCKFEEISIDQFNGLSTERGENGFGHTGI